MIENGKTMLVVLDEFDNAFRSARFDWTSEVTSVAGYTTFRPLVVILSGSAARLLPLAVKKLSNSDAAAQGYFMQEHTFDMNSTKYVPKTLSPICSLPEFKLALKAVRGSEADGLYDDQIWRLCFETRGCVRCMKKCKLPAADQLDSDQFRSVFPFKTAFNSLFGPYKKVIEHLLRTVQELLLVHELQLENVNNVGNLLYEMADNGLINFDGDVEFGFAFPADILTCLHLFYEQSPEDGIGIIEKISLYFPQNAGTLDVNENLVFDSFCSIEQFTGGWSLLLLAFKLKS
ncbi:hypothetical protein MIR68_001737 [Amoeboaphelidium protococcarum]|nr:hypothetical protein MIR68_001737 [Amoeboaphelidium protococcarum]